MQISRMLLRELNEGENDGTFFRKLWNMFLMYRVKLRLPTEVTTHYVPTYNGTKINKIYDTEVETHEWDVTYHI